jgi:acylphosphatase
MAMVRKHIRITGRVQGVGFRAWAARQAEALGLGGHVRNLDDGSVEAEVEGEAAAVAAFVAACRPGPPAARGAALEVSEAAPRGAGSFRIER